MRGAATTVDNGLEGGVLLDAAAGNVAIHADAFGRKAGRLSHPELSVSVRSRPAVQRPAAELVRRAPTGAVARRVVHLQRGLHRRRGDAEQRALWHPRHRRRGAPARASTRARPSSPARASIARRRAASTRCASGTASPTTSTTSSGLPIRSMPSSDGVRQTFTNKEQEGRVEVQLLPFDLRFAALTTALGVQAGQQKLTAPGDTPGAVQRTVRPERQPARRRLHLQRVQVQRVDQGAGRRPHRACAAQRHARRTFPPISCPTAIRSIPTPRNPEFTPKSISVGADPESALGSRRQRHGAARRARAEAGRAVLARAA